MSQTGCSTQDMEPFALRVIGRSMEPEFTDGNIIIVDPGHPVVNGVYVVVEKEDEHGTEVVFGQYFEDGSRCWVKYLNPEFEAVELPLGFSIKGVITQRNSRRRKDIKHYEYPDV